MEKTIKNSVIASTEEKYLSIGKIKELEIPTSGVCWPSACLCLCACWDIADNQKDVE